MGQTLAKIGYATAGLALVAFGGFAVYLLVHDDIARAIDAIQNDKIRGSLSDSPLGQNNPLDKALRGGDLYILPSIKTNVGYSFLDRAEEEYEPWALH